MKNHRHKRLINNRQLNIRISESLKNDFKDYLDRTGRTATNFFKDAIETALLNENNDC